MRLELDSLEAFEVDFEAIPFGSDNGSKGIYRPMHGKRYYIGPKPWIRLSGAHLTVISTETLVCDVAERALKSQKLGKARGRLNLTKDPGLPEQSPHVQFDRPGATARPDEERVSALAREILAANENAIVIANGTEMEKGKRLSRSKEQRVGTGLRTRISTLS